MKNCYAFIGIVRKLKILYTFFSKYILKNIVVFMSNFLLEDVQHWCPALINKMHKCGTWVVL
jgi:hypothetical protein